MPYHWANFLMQSPRSYLPTRGSPKWTKTSYLARNITSNDYLNQLEYQISNIPIGLWWEKQQQGVKNLGDLSMTD